MASSAIRTSAPTIKTDTAPSANAAALIPGILLLAVVGQRRQKLTLTTSKLLIVALLKGKLAGRADMGKVSGLVKAALSKKA